MRKLFLLLLLAMPLWAAQQNGFHMDVLLDGRPPIEYAARGTTYIEALKGRDYEIRLTNPLGIRVAVALAVDGLNSIDARHTDARSARKWVLDPYETITIRGWQINGQQARRFFFTTEENSYGKWLGRTENLGVITAAFFRERTYYEMRPGAQMAPAPAERQAAPRAGVGGGPASAERAEKADQAARPSDEYAATGIGDTISHPVTQVHLELEQHPASVVTIRYEYRPGLIALGVLPQPVPVADPLRRRERARAFSDGGFCPNPR